MDERISIPIEVKSGSRDDIRSLFQVFSNVRHPVLLATDESWTPATDVFETDEEFVILMDVAFVDPKDLKIVFQDNILFITGIRREMTKYNKRHYHKMEIDYGPFERKLTVPDDVDKDSIKTKYKSGFLEIRLKKVEDRRKGERVINIDFQD